MKFEEIEELLQYNEKEFKIFIANEVFEDLKGAIKNSPHLAFAYSYLFIITWLYRYAKHMSRDGLIDNGKIKEILGYNSMTKGLDYIIKKNGLLDKLGYTITSKDFPIAWTFNQFEGLEFLMYSEQKELLEVWELPRKYSIKYPVKAFERTLDEAGNIEQEGTFFEVENTHMIPFEVFMYCMDNKDIGTIGFYLYSYIKRMNDFYADGWDISIENMVLETGIAEKTLLRYLDKLKKFNLIQAVHNQEYFCLALDPKERKANTYIANEFDLFTYKPQFYKKMKIMKIDEYQKKKEEEFTKMFGNTVDFPIEELPY
ncbi:hypothetical protein JGK52_03915 [Cytobacillus oceanisediminis]|uniref:hypothetical protein n=1 Tax=Cytobacillus oceanisediminis TaxID=665099 RepID=UPI001D145231|nr:hypothetical protein [Cytobacillus oceanisediminis]MCC3645831.1 hypothetical protein [Cytobacillus oceanisediminis]